MRTLQTLVLGLLLAACKGEPGDGACVAGVEHACACDGAGAGVKVCGDDGEFGECDCSQLCAPTTCEAESVACGPLEDGCGTTLDCGVCPTDACAEGTDDCDEHATCTPAGNSFTCACADGYMGDGKACAPDPDTYVADLGDNEVEVTIDGVGVVHVGRLSKIGVRVVMTRVQTTHGPEPFPSRVDTPSVTLGDVRAAPSVITALRDWIDAGTAHSVTVRLYGLGGELTALTSVEVLPSALDSTVTTQGPDSVLASLRIQPVMRWVIADRVSMDSNFWPVPYPGTEVEIEGITSQFGCDFAEGEVVMELTDTKLVLPGCADGWALINWMYKVTYDFDSHAATYEWKSLGVIDRDAGGNEFHRRNAYETLPTEVMYFDPTRPYGTTPLTTVVIELGKVVEA